MGQIPITVGGPPTVWKLHTWCPIMYCKYTISLFWPRNNPGYAILLAEKAPAGMGTPRPGFAKLRVALLLRENCLVGRAADGGVFWAKNNVSSPQRICLLRKENMFSSHREYVFFRQRICLLQTENMSSSDTEYVFFKQKTCLLHTENMSTIWGMGGRCPVRFRAGAGMKN